MFRPVRAAAYAVGALALAFSAIGDPLQAWQGEPPVAQISYISHETAAAADGDLGLNEDPAPGLLASSAAPIAADDHNVALADITIADHPAPAAPVSLEVRVATLGAAVPVGDEEDCLARAVYFEARGEPLEGQLAVAEVIMNRASSGRYPSTYCGVVRQTSQFSFVRRGIIPQADRSSQAWRRAVAMARVAEAGEVRLLSTEVLWYHANYVSPTWCRRLARNTRIGVHIFYS
jgi:spore germination cell wall hydrolase CwlJ-like protein